MERSGRSLKRCSFFCLHALAPICITILFLGAIPGSVGAAPVPGRDTGAWIQTFPDCGSCEGHGLILTGDGGYLVTGTSGNGGGQTDMLVLKTDGAGNEQVKTTAGTGTCEGNTLAGIPSKDTVLLGGGCPAGTGSATITTIDPLNGRVRRAWNYDPGRHASVTAMAPAGDGGFLVLEEADTSSPGRTDRDVIIRRIDPEGATIWVTAYSGPGNDTGRAVLTAPDGGFVIAGSTGAVGSRGDDIFLMELNATGSQQWIRAFGTEGDDTAQGLVQAADGGYLVAGTSCTRGIPGTCDIYTAKTGSDGALVGEHRYGGSGNEKTAAIMAAPGGGYTIAGTTDSTDLGAQDQDILILHIDEQGKELWHSTFGTPAFDYLSGATLDDDGSLGITGYTADPVDTGTHTLFLIKAGNGGRSSPDDMILTHAAVQETGIREINVRDAKTGAGIAGAMVYFDGNLVGQTSAKDGSFNLGKQDDGSHSVRITKDGYRETTVIADENSGNVLSVRLVPSPVHRILGTGSPENSLDIVFVASNTSYDGQVQQKTAADRYIGHEDAFLADVRHLVGDRLLHVEEYSRVPSLIPADYGQRLNIYYYWDESSYADAFNGCAGTLPEGFWDDAPFADVAVILYPSYTGNGSSSEPQGCSNGLGPGLQSWFKAPADKGQVFLHESGHAVFGLMDTYCGETYYAENQPFPNIWGSQAGCRQDASKNAGWNVSLCRPLSSASSLNTTSCGNGFWKYDPSPDLMGGTGPTAKFGEAATLRIQYILDGFRGG